MKYVLFASVIMMVGCQDRPAPPTEQEIAAIASDAPKVFIGGKEASLEGLDGIWLGQSQADAEAVMKTMCSRFVELDGGWQRAHTIFKGCHLPDDSVLYTFRVGFNPKIQNRVFTVEVKRRYVPQNLVRKRFFQNFAPVNVDYVRAGMLKAETPTTNMFADWEEGVDGPTHILLGLSDVEVDRLAKP